MFQWSLCLRTKIKSLWYQFVVQTWIDHMSAAIQRRQHLCRCHDRGLQVQRRLLEGNFGVDAMRICLVLQVIIPADNILVATHLRRREGDLHRSNALHATIQLQNDHRFIAKAYSQTPSIQQIGPD